LFTKQPQLFVASDGTGDNQALRVGCSEVAAHCSHIYCLQGVVVGVIAGSRITHAYLVGIDVRSFATRSVDGYE
jgi:hypothetical protein